MNTNLVYGGSCSVKKELPRSPSAAKKRKRARRLAEASLEINRAQVREYIGRYPRKTSHLTREQRITKAKALAHKQRMEGLLK